MAYQRTYKILFQVNILHSYYLDGINGASFFDLDVPTRAKRLERYSISKDIEIEPTANCLKQIKANEMLFKTTDQGFAIMILAKSDPNHSEIFIPESHLDTEFTLSFKMRVKNPWYFNLTNMWHSYYFKIKGIF